MAIRLLLPLAALAALLVGAWNLLNEGESEGFESNVPRSATNTIGSRLAAHETDVSPPVTNAPPRAHPTPTERGIAIERAGRGRIGTLQVSALRNVASDVHAWPLLRAIGTLHPPSDIQTVVMQGENGVARSLSRLDGLDGATLFYERDGTWVVRSASAPTSQILVADLTRIVIGNSTASPRRRKAKRTTPDERARSKALKDAVGASTDDRARILVEEALRDPLASVRETAIGLLTRWDDCAAVVYEHLTREDHAEVREACLDAIGRHGDVSYIETLGAWSSQFSERGVLKRVDKARKRIAKRFGLERPTRLAPKKKR